MNDADDVEAELASRSLAEVTSPPRLAFGSNTRRAGLETDGQVFQLGTGR
jgi:hypothetical protein